MDKAIFTRRDAVDVNHRLLREERVGGKARHIALQFCDQLNAVHKEFGEEVALLVADKMQLEAVEPSHRALTALGKPFEHLVEMDSLIPADTQRRAVHETDTSAAICQDGALLEEIKTPKGFNANAWEVTVEKVPVQ